MSQATATTSEPLRTPDNTVAGALERKIAASRRAILVEQLWPLLWLPIGVVALFLAVSFAGVWPLLPPVWHAGLLAGFVLALVASLVPIARVRGASRKAALERLEAQSGLPHRPASSYEDTLAPIGSERSTAALWVAHRRRLLSLVSGMRARSPQPRTEPTDPLALRVLLLLAAGIGAVVAGDAFSDRLASAFRLSPIIPAAVTRLDAWLTPPLYTGRQPILLADGSKTVDPDKQVSQRIEAPEGSVLVVRAAGSGHESYGLVTLADAAASPVSVQPEAQADAGGSAATQTPVSEFHLTLGKSQIVRVVDAGSERLSWSFQVIPDAPPQITLTRDPQQGARGALLLNYRVTDDYGVASAQASFALAEPAAAKPLKLADGSEIGPMGEAPTLPLKLNRQASNKDIVGKSSLDLTAHLWAGLKVRMLLSAKDQAGHTGEAAAREIVLPTRSFRNPLARALIEQRRDLAFMPASYMDVRLALDALSIAPDRFPIDPTAYLGLRSIYWQLTAPPSKEGFQDVVDQLWALALKIETGKLSDAEMALKDAEDKLSKALEEGASDEEIQRLMQELKQALNQFLKEMAEQAAKDPGAEDQPSQGAKELTDQDLQQMLKQMEQMSRSGNKDAAQQMLSDLRDMLDRLQSGRMARSGQSGKMREMMDKFGDMIGKQRKLLDDTFKAGRGRRQGLGQEGQSGEEGQSGQQQGDGQGSLDELDKRQGALRRQLQDMMQQLQGLNGDTQDQLDGAGKSMEDAQGSLQEDDPDTAADNQAKALDQLRKGAQKLTDEMLQGQNGQVGSQGGNDDRDPLGRQWKSDGPETDGGSTKVPKEIDVQRARRILEELRRRLSETNRPAGELDYLERLLGH